jgi:hypothetical protein
MYHAACHCELDEAKERLHGTVNKIDGKTMLHESPQQPSRRTEKTRNSSVCFLSTFSKRFTHYVDHGEVTQKHLPTLTC